MSEAHHKDPSKRWLVFFFVCFALVVFGIGFYNSITYKADSDNPNQPLPATDGTAKKGMMLPEQAPHAISIRVG